MPALSPVSNFRAAALVFDLGGVLLDIDFGRAFNAWAPYSGLSIGQMASTFQFDDAYRQHERGEIGAEEYFAHLAKTLQLSAPLSAIREGWNALLIGEIADTRKLVEVAARHVPCYLFTNTNATHMAAWIQLCPGLTNAFARTFASHEIGLRKPDRAAFDFISNAIGLPPSAIAFYDDLPENVAGAADAGLHAVQVRSSRDIAASLAAQGFRAEVLR